jgi:putative SOS response-associated peptidase YedK
MCGRFTLRTPAADLAEVFQLRRAPETQARYNIAPTQPVAVVRQAGKDRKLSLIRWGMVPSWSDDPNSGRPLFNARGETVAKKPEFRIAFRRRRCLIPADGFYEWKKTEAGTRQPFFIRLAKDGPFAFAGLWECWRRDDALAIESCTIITTEANKLLRHLHDRMPVILADEDFDAWLDPTIDDPGTLQALIQPLPAEALTAYRVSTLVNSPRNESPECIVRLSA